MPRDGAGPVALQEHVGPGGEAAQRRLVRRLPQVERRAALAPACVHDQRRQGRQMRAGDVQHLGAMRREGARRDRPGDHPRQVEHAQPVERPGAEWRQRRRRRIADAFDDDRRQRGGGRALRVRRPFRQAARHGGDQPGLGCGGFQRLGRPALQGAADGVAVVVAAEQPQHPVPVVGEVGVQAHPAPVPAAVQPGNAVPAFMHRRARDAQVVLGAELGQRMGHVHADTLGRPAAGAMDRSGGRPGGADAGDGRGADGEGGRFQRVRAGQGGFGQRRGVEAGVVPQRGGGIGGGGDHAPASPGGRARSRPQPLRNWRSTKAR